MKEKEIEKKNFENMLSLKCTLREIAAVFRCSDQTIRNWCKKTYGTNFEEQKLRFEPVADMRLRNNLYKLSEKNASVAIFLAKNYLGMTDTPIIENNEETNALLKTLVDTIKERNVQRETEKVNTSELH